MDRWEFQERKIEALYHMFGNTLWGYSLKFRPYIALIYIYIYGRYLQVGIQKFPLSGVDYPPVPWVLTIADDIDRPSNRGETTVPADREQQGN